jgi:hypothetical protein
MVTLLQKQGFVTLKELDAKRISKRAPSSIVWLRAKESVWLATAGIVNPNCRHETILTGEYRIYKSKYKDKNEVKESAQPDEKQPRNKSRTRSIFGRRKPNS